MRVPTPLAAAAFVCLACLTSSSAAAATEDKPKTKPPKPCTIRSSTSGSFFDLNPLYIAPPDKDSKSKKDDKIAESWHVRGHDYGANFTMNFCGPVVEELEEVVGVSESSWKNVSAFYTIGKRTYSLGSQNSELVLRGRELVLNYTGGSPCYQGHPHTRRAVLPHNVETIGTAKVIDDDDDDDQSKKPARPTRRKAAIISLLCDKKPLAPKAPKASIAFVGTLDHCTYTFQVRSSAACAAAETSSQGALGPGGVFGVIMLIALLVYLVGGCVYQRTVLNQRGWKQIPNYSMWAGCCGFFLDIFVIMTSSCARFLPGRRGYSRISLGNGSAHSRSRDHRSEAENRLIDNLDEEWDD